MKRTGSLNSKLEFDGDIWTLEADADWQSVIHSCCEVWRMIDCYGGGLVQGLINIMLAVCERLRLFICIHGVVDANVRV